LNWKKLPGVTNFQTSAPLKVLGFSGYRNKGDFTGGVVNGENGISAFKVNRDSLTGNKAYFWLNDKMICLGAAISSDLEQPIFTTINQAKLKGPVYYFDDTIKTLNDAVYNSESIKWVYHNKIGYYNLQPSNITVSSKSQTGSWGDIAFVYDKEEPITKPVFTLDIQQDRSSKTSSYAYALVPDITFENFKTFKPDFSVIENTKKVQAIASVNKTILMIAVYEPSTVQVKSFPMLKFVSSGLYIIEKSKTGWRVAIADPTQKLDKAIWQIGDKMQATSLPQNLHKGETTYVNISYH
jgi:chondroitin AC lyase